MKSPICCEEHGESFELSQELHKWLLAFVDQGIKYIKTGDISLISGMVLLACNIKSHPEYYSVRPKLVERGFATQLEVLDFLAHGGRQFKDRLTKNITMDANA